MELRALYTETLSFKPMQAYTQTSRHGNAHHLHPLHSFMKTLSTTSATMNLTRLRYRHAKYCVLFGACLHGIYTHTKAKFAFKAWTEIRMITKSTQDRLVGCHLRLRKTLNIYWTKHITIEHTYIHACIHT